MKKLTVAVDTMGGDLGYASVVRGAVLAVRDYPFLEIILVGPEDVIKRQPALSGIKGISIAHAPDVITPDESPTLAFRRKKESTIVVGLKLVKEGKAGGFVSAGSTGALLTGATVIVGRKSGVERPVLGTLLPNAKRGFTLLADSGANMDCKPSYLLQFAELGAEYMQKAGGVKEPKIGLLNVGTEAEKGNAITKEAYGLLMNSELNFLGNIEGRDVSSGFVDVAVCDGFTGNVILKHTEGLAKTLMGMVREELMSTTVSKIGALLAKGAFGNLRKRFDYREVGGTPFLGLKSLVVKAHGSSDEKAIKNAIRQCVEYGI
jgi:glycerol-3-phosphate acyltransferase PlsX